MADDERPAVGTVAQEAARLLDALGGWASTTQAGYAAAAGGARTSPNDAGPDRGRDPDRNGDPDSGGGGGMAPRCESCGADNGAGQAVTCQLCPVCQGIGLLRSVRPETVDRLADLAAALAATLRDMAGQRRTDDATAQGRASGTAGGKAAGKSSGAARGRVQDIVVDDEDEHHTGSANS